MSTSADMMAMRYMFEKHGTLPLEYIELDDYSKGVISAFLEDICDVAIQQRKELEQQTNRAKRR